jgi:hypothetical protein
MLTRRLEIVAWIGGDVVVVVVAAAAWIVIAVPHDDPGDDLDLDLHKITLLLLRLPRESLRPD